MKPGFHPSRAALGLSLLFSILAFGLGFELSYRQDCAQVAEIGLLSWAHFSYAAELKDDMAVIDWSKNLEKLEAVRAFQVNVDSKTVAEGGNQNYLSQGFPEGVSYLFPSGWSFRLVSEPKSGPKRDFTLVYQSHPGPFWWGLCLFLSCLLTGLSPAILPVFFPSTDPIPSSTHPQKENVSGKSRGSPPNPATSAVRPVHAPSNGQSAYLFVDKHYVIQQASREAESLLQKSSDILLNRHLLDLLPDPDLIHAMERAADCKIPTPFPDYPQLSVLLKNDPQGFFLILEKEDISSRPKKP